MNQGPAAYWSSISTDSATESEMELGVLNDVDYHEYHNVHTIYHNDIRNPRPTGSRSVYYGSADIVKVIKS